jgi:hypothetical protein
MILRIPNKCKSLSVGDLLIRTLRGWRSNHEMFWTRYILRQIKVLSQTQNTVDAVYINLLQNLQNVIIFHHPSTLVSLISLWTNSQISSTGRAGGRLDSSSLVFRLFTTTIDYLCCVLVKTVHLLCLLCLRSSDWGPGFIGREVD